jgi:tetratricopeptide (TPR) repeat protein
METDDIRMMMAYLKRIQPAPGVEEPAPSPVVKTPAPSTAPKTAKKPAQPVVRDAGYWMEQGQLAATYGAYGPAVSYYKKALAMGAEGSRVFFNMGIAYGELGDYDRALDHLHQALQMAPEKGAYYYGRARVYLLSGNRAMALTDFEHAAKLGDLDARQYLKAAGHR